MLKRSRTGFALAESLAAAVILAVAVVGVSGALIASQQQSGVQHRLHVLTMLGQQLMERVAALPMAKADGTTGVTGWPTIKDATQYDTLDDFAGYEDVVDASNASEISTAGTPAAMTGTDPKTLTTPDIASAGGAAITRSVSIEYPSAAFGVANAVGDVAVVKVTVRAGLKDSLTFTRLICRWSATRSG